MKIQKPILLKCDYEILEEHIQKLYDKYDGMKWGTPACLKKGALIDILEYMKRQFTIIKDK